MGIFSTISYYMDKALDTIGIGSNSNESKKTDAQNKTKNVTKSVVKTTNTKVSKPVIQTDNIPKNEDKATFSQKAKESQKQSPQNVRTRTAIQQSIQNKCIKYGIDGNKLIRELKKHSGMSDGEYEKLSEDEKREIWAGIELIFDSAIKQAKTSGISVETSLEAVITETVKNFERDVKTGKIVDVQAILSQADFVKQRLESSDFQSKSKEEQNKIFNQIHTQWETHKQKYIETTLSLYPESMKAKKRADLEEIFKKAEMVAFSQVVISEDSETAFRAIRLAGPKSFAYCNKMIGRTRASAADMKNYYDNVATGEATIELYNDCYTRGEKPDGTAVREMNTDLMANKSSEAVQAFQAAYLNARESGRYVELEQDGIFTEMAAGNLAGSQLNQNLSIEERAQFVNGFYKSEQQFGDLDVVVEKSNLAIDSYIKENSANEAKLREDIAQIQQKTHKQLAVSIAKSNAVKHSKGTKTTSTNSEKTNKSQASEEVLSISKKSETEQHTNVNSALSVLQKEVNEKQIVTAASSETAIQMALASGEVTIEEAVNQSKDSKKVYRVLFSNSSLLTKYSQDAVEYITRQSKVDDLVEMANCIKAIELIRINSKVDDKDGLYAKLEKKATSIQKNLFEKENEKYAAA